jgi:hypothetical protein
MFDNIMLTEQYTLQQQQHSLCEALLEEAGGAMQRHWPHPAHTPIHININL